MRGTRTSLRRSAGSWTGCRWRSSWRRRGSTSSRSPRCETGSPHRWRCSGASGPTCQTGCGRCETRSRGATSCWTRRSRRSSGGSLCSAVAFPPMRPSRSGRPRRAGSCVSSCTGAWSCARSCPTGQSGMRCWRRSGRMGRSGFGPPARSGMFGGRMRTGTSRSPRTPSRSCRRGPSSTGTTDSTSRSRTSGPRSNGCSRTGTSTVSCASAVLSGGTCRRVASCANAVGGWTGRLPRRVGIRHGGSGRWWVLATSRRTCGTSTRPVPPSSRRATSRRHSVTRGGRRGR